MRNRRKEGAGGIDDRREKVRQGTGWKDRISESNCAKGLTVSLGLKGYKVVLTTREFT